MAVTKVNGRWLVWLIGNSHGRFGFRLQLCSKLFNSLGGAALHAAPAELDSRVPELEVERVLGPVVALRHARPLRRAREGRGDAHVGVEDVGHVAAGPRVRPPEHRHGVAVEPDTGLVPGTLALLLPVHRARDALKED